MSRPPDALAELTARHRPEIARYLVRLVGDADEAEDVCQDVFLRAHRAFDRLAPDSNARAWLYRIATNSGLNAVRGRARRVAHTADVEVDGIASGDGASPERGAELRAVVRAVQGLPPRQRAALVLRQWEGLGYAEIAGVLGGNEAAARANVYQAIRRLRLVLGGPQ